MKTEIDLSKATPRPWKIHQAISGSGPMADLVGHNSDGQPKYNAMIEAPAYFVAGVSGVGKDECLANSALIVKAVNEHDALVAVAEAAAAYRESRVTQKNKTSALHNYEQAVEALAAIRNQQSPTTS